ncbi:MULTISPECIES: hypothetical protein [unclassified Streptomyces]|uniref:hypothetical protein n=1 Tax=unclassified Streptomyces TaxID=2593676 RepID=UPI001BE88F59|nr:MULTISPECIES: hypothetical protein [unclassified Streptomyces]MBT2404925.1 hypothetical protein [Streptomyces sp. ISL-21]MBT2455957.1 hypothetical protein [Streptomyces sp. ISL-86]MBT2611346.1 hypothetical protein [Streptomyces sp. ISL-87]
MALDDPHPTSDDNPTTTSTQRSDTPLLPEAELLAGTELLPCGRPLTDAWQQARSPGAAAHDAHTSGCPYCRQAVEGLRALDQATRTLRAEEQPDVHHLANRVINAVRAEVRLGTSLPLDDPDHGLRIAESAAAKVLRRAADTVPGARAASCRLTPTRNDTAVHVVMTLATTLDQPLPERAAQVRQAVLHAAQHELGLAVTDVDLEINTLLDPLHVPLDDLPDLPAASRR